MYIWFLSVFFETLIDLVSYPKTVTSQNRSNSGLLCRGPSSLECMHLWAHSSESWLKQAAILGAFKIHNPGILKCSSWASDILWYFDFSFNFFICHPSLTSQPYGYPVIWPWWSQDTSSQSCTFSVFLSLVHWQPFTSTQSLMFSVTQNCYLTLRWNNGAVWF